MDIELFNYDLPHDLIAQTPSEKRDNSRLLVINKNKQIYEDKHFFNIIDYLKPGDVLVRNNTKVLPVRLFGVKEVTNAKVEVLLLKEISQNTYECLCGNARVIKEETIINFSSRLKGKCVGVKDEGIRLIQFIYQGIFVEILEEVGHMPLPPYIKKQLVSNDRYQTVYATKNGSAAAPTAGFHFTQELFKKIKEKGIEVLDVTLHIGLDTFRPVKVKDTKDHHMHSEYYEISTDVANKLNQAKKEHRRIIAIGTTATRTLEANMSKYGRFTSCHENTDIFIYPGYQFKGIDALITNFHLPKSTLIMLVSALMGREFTLQCYQHAVKEKYRFFSFGDACFIY